jgi:hypothetical protein
MGGKEMISLNTGRDMMQGSFSLSILYDDYHLPIHGCPCKRTGD